MPTTTMLQPIPYLFFNGDCAEAMRFYEKTLGGTIKVMMTGAQMPVDQCAEPTPKEFMDRIVNAQLELPGGYLLYAGDCHPQISYDGIRGISLTLNFATVEEAEQMFNALAEGGEIGMPFAPAFWAEKFGMVTDKFGVDWIINGVLQIP